MKKRFKKGDLVLVIAGDDRGKKGKILELFLKKNKVKVEGINVVVRHVKPRGQGQKRGRIQREAFISASKIMRVDDGSKRPVRSRGSKLEGGAHE